MIEEEPNGPIDFSEAEEQPDGSLCVIKTQYVEKLEKQQIKECWHDNVTQCHETYVTEFKPQQEQLCEENFWKACKITFKETNFNYTLQVKKEEVLQSTGLSPILALGGIFFSKNQRRNTSQVFPNRIPTGIQI